ncbi:class I SAM-dependent DNA methyltransferase [Amycolatopsis sp. NPDC057786]|uniref:class I SAM-dependent DNA methyltransferase n=1 Tax=Amycolatopsis sp. NPDC057786 TaxID=3346250 RepID=UPI00366C2E8C
MTLQAETSDNNVYDDDLSEIYDQIYTNRARDYQAEAALLAAIVRARRPEAASLLDVACGTAEHLAALKPTFTRLEGLELSAQMRERARAKVPGVQIHEGDMRRFDLGRTYDAVCCLFNSISFMATTDELDSAIGSMANHLSPGGVLVIDPWYSPEQYIEGYVSDSVTRSDGRTIARVSHSAREGRRVRQEAHFVTADSSGINHFVNVQRLTLFTRDEYAAALEKAGCAVELVEGADSLSPDTGTFVGVRR